MKAKFKSGFIGMILLVIAIILALTYFGVNFRKIVDSPTGQDNFGFLKEIGLKIWDFAVSIWNNYLRESATAVWDFAWSNFEKIKGGLPLPK